MASPSIAVSETVLLVASVEQHFTANHIYGVIVVDNSGDSGGTGLTANNFEIYVCTDGGRGSGGIATIGASHCEMVPAGQTRVFNNLGPLPNSNVVSGAAAYSNGVTKAFDQSESVNWTAQSGYAVTNGTFCSVISAGTPEVTITFQ